MRMLTAQEHDDLLAAKEKCDAFAAQLERLKFLGEDAALEADAMSPAYLRWAEACDQTASGDYLEQRDAEMRAQGAESVARRLRDKEAWARQNNLFENAKLYRRCANVAKNKADDHRCGRDA